MDEALQSQARHLYAVEKLSIRQVAQKLGVIVNQGHIPIMEREIVSA